MVCLHVYFYLDYGSFVWTSITYGLFIPPWNIVSCTKIWKHVCSLKKTVKRLLVNKSYLSHEVHIWALVLKKRSIYSIFSSRKSRPASFLIFCWDVVHWKILLNPSKTSLFLHLDNKDGSVLEDLGWLAEWCYNRIMALKYKLNTS